MSTNENKDLIRHILEAVARGDLSALDGHPGYEETRRVMPMVQDAFPDLTWTIERQVAEGDFVATHTWLEGTHLGSFVGVPPTGRAVRVQNVAIDRVADGVVVEHNAATDWFRALFELGVLPLSGK